MKSEISVANAKVNYNHFLRKFNSDYIVIVPFVFFISRVSLVNNLLPFGVPLFVSLYGLNVNKIVVAVLITLGMLTVNGGYSALITGISILLFSVFVNRYSKNKTKNAVRYNRIVPNFRSDSKVKDSKAKSGDFSETYEFETYKSVSNKNKNNNNNNTAPNLASASEIILNRKTKQYESFSDLKLALMGVVCSLIPNIIFIYLRGMLLYDLIISLLHAFIAFVMIFIMRKAANMLDGNKTTRIFTNEEVISAAIVSALMISGVGDVKFLGFGLKNVISVLSILLLSFKSGANVGATAGVIIGLVLSLSSSGAPLLIGCYALCGLISGVFKTLGKIGTSLGFLLGNIVLMMYLSSFTSIETLILIKELVLAIAIFMFIPKKIISKIPEITGVGSAFRGNNEIALNLRVREIIVDKLNKFSKTFKEVARTFNELSPTKVVINNQDISSMLDRVADRICRECSLCLHCWDKNFYTTYQVMFKIIEKLDSKGFLDRKDIPQSFINRCERINEFIAAVNNMYEIFKVDMMWKNRLGENRNLVSRQLEELSKAIKALAVEIQYEIDFKSGIENAISSMLKREGIKNVKVFAFQNKFGKYEVSVSLQECNDRKFCSNVIEKIVSHVVGKRMKKDNIGCKKEINNYGSNRCIIRFIEEEVYDIATGVAFVSKYDERYSERYGSAVNGDSYAFMNTNDGKFVVALSDGMGSGEKAAFQSRITLNLIEQFMETGFDKDITIKLINSILALNSSEDYYSTIDMSVIDLGNGNTEFVKIGAAPTYIKKNDKVEIVKTASLPAGILENMEIELVNKQLSDGDMLIMISDGVLEAYAIDAIDNEDEIKNNEVSETEKEKTFIDFIREIKSINPQTVADTILDEAYKKCGSKPFDDMTVVVAKFWRKLPG